MEGTLEKTVQHLSDLLDDGWKPSGVWTDPVISVPRKHNLVSDYLCNDAMDHKRSVYESSDICLPKQFHIAIHSDGGSRNLTLICGMDGGSPTVAGGR